LGALYLTRKAALTQGNDVWGKGGFFGHISTIDHEHKANAVHQMKKEK